MLVNVKLEELWITSLHVGRQEPQIKQVILLSLFSLLSLDSVGEKKGSCVVVHTI